MADGDVNSFTDGNFKAEVLNSSVPVLVDFWAPWCGPCLRVAPVVQEIAKEYSGSLKVGKLNVDENHQVAMNYGIQSIPTLMVFKSGEMKERIVGAVPKDIILKAVTKHIGAKD
jgi:thioredoxin 1